MKSTHLPKWIEPRKMAEKGLQITGKIPLAELQRLSAVLTSSEGEASIELNFSLDEQGFSFIKGQMQTEVWLLCQRCLEPYLQAISTEFILSPVTNDKEAGILPSPYEPLLVENSVVELATIVEEEILLSLPLIAKHEPENCSIAITHKVDDNEQVFISEKVSPFTVLANLKTNKH